MFVIPPLPQSGGKWDVLQNLGAISALDGDEFVLCSQSQYVNFSTFFRVAIKLVCLGVAYFQWHEARGVILTLSYRRVDIDIGAY